MNNAQLLKQRKPTGDAFRPPEVERAYELDEEINERAGSRHINDSEHGGSNSESDNDDGVVEIGSSSESEVGDDSDNQVVGAKTSKTKAATQPRTASKGQRVAKAVRAPSPVGPGNRRAGRSAAGNAGLVANISQAFDP